MSVCKIRWTLQALFRCCSASVVYKVQLVAVDLFNSSSSVPWHTGKLSAQVFRPQAFGPVFFGFFWVVEECLCSSVEQGKNVLKIHLPSFHWDALKFPGFELGNFNLKTDVAMMSRRYFLLFLWTYTGLQLNYTPLKNQICTCFWEPDRIILQRFFVYQSWRRVPCLWFQHFSCRFIKNCSSTKEKEQCWEQGKNLSSDK